MNNKTSRKISDLRLIVTSLTVGGLLAASLHAAEWPQFRGPTRDGKSPETGLLKKWPEGGPELLRTISGVGGGFSSPVVSGERMTTFTCMTSKNRKLTTGGNPVEQGAPSFIHRGIASDKRPASCSSCG